MLGTAPALTGIPWFSPDRIAPEEPFALTVPVNEFTDTVRIVIVREDRPSNIAYGQDGETGGNGTVTFVVGDANLAEGNYLLRDIFLTGPNVRARRLYTSDGQPSYLLWTYTGPETGFSCATSIPVVSFTVDDTLD